MPVNFSAPYPNVSLILLPYLITLSVSYQESRVKGEQKLAGGGGFKKKWKEQVEEK